MKGVCQMANSYEDSKNEIRIILKAFCKGKKNAIHAIDLAKRLDKTSGETMRKYINELRKEGIPICSIKEGFYYAESKREIEDTIAHLESRALDMMTCAEALRNTLKSNKL
jgi:biotin operon repressor